MNKQSTIDRLCIICLIFTILSCYSVIFLVNYRIIYICMFLSAILLYFATSKRTVVCTKSMLYIIATFSVCYFILIFFGQGYTDFTFQVIALFFILFYFVLTTAYRKIQLYILLEAYEKIIFFISIISCLFYLFGTILRFIQPSGYIDYVRWSSNYNYTNYYWLYFEGQSTNLFGNVFIRNMALFAEGPIYSCLLTIALYIELFICQKGKKYLFVILIAMLSTFSTTSLAIGSVLLFIFFYNKYLRNKRLVIIMPIIIIFIAWFVFLVVVDKLQSTNISGSIRIDDIRACFYSWLKSPLVGNGFQNIEALNPFRAQWRGSSAGNSTGIGGVLSNGGIILGIWYFTPFIVGLIKFRKSKIKEYLGLSILIFIIFFVMIIHFTAFGSCLLAIQWTITTYSGKEIYIKVDKGEKKE